VDRLAPAVAVDDVVPVGDQVAERTAVVAERHAALHAARALLAQALDGQRVDELVEVARAGARIALGLLDPGDLEEAADLAHQRPRSATRRSSASASASSCSAR